MTIKGKITALVAAFTILVLGLALDLVLIDIITERENKRDRISNEVILNIFELNTLTLEYPTNRSPEFLERWTLKHEETLNSLDNASIVFERPETVKVIENSKKDIKEVGVIFEELAEFHAAGNFAATQEEQALINELSEKSVAAASGIRVLNEISVAREKTIRSLLVFFSIAIASALVLVMVVGAIILIRNIINPIRESKEIVENLSKNNFDVEVSPNLLNRSDEIGQWTQALNNMLGELKEANQLKSEFTALASHELRTPLSIINMHVDMLKDVEVENEEIKESLENIANATDKMTHLTNTMLGASAIEFGTISAQRKNTEIIRIIEEETNNLSPLTKKKNIKIKKMFFEKKSLVAYTDSQLLRIAVVNLISNAIKYTPEGGVVTVGAYYVSRKNCVEIAVMDSGYGIPEKEQDKVFEKRYRAKNIFKDKKADGTGLGLYTVKYLVEKLGGAIWFVSQENEGTSFFVRLPVKKDYDVEKSKIVRKKEDTSNHRR